MRSLRHLAPLVVLTLVATPLTAQTRPTFPTPTAAAAHLAESVRSFLFAARDVESPRFHVLAGPAVRATARHLTDRLNALGYEAAARDDATILLHLTLESSHRERDERSLRHVRLTPVVPTGPPIDVEYATLRWYDAPPRHGRVISSLDRHHDRETAIDSALIAARRAIARAVSEREPGLAGQIRRALHGRPHDEIASASFVARDDAGYYRAHLLVSFRPDRLERVVADARARRAAHERRHLVKWLLFGAGLLTLLVGYAWADGRTRGYLRGPLRAIALGGIAVLVFGVWVV